MAIIIIIIIIIIKKDWQCKAGRGRLTPYQSEYPSPTLPTYNKGKEKKEKEKKENKKCLFKLKIFDIAMSTYIS